MLGTFMLLLATKRIPLGVVVDEESGFFGSAGASGASAGGVVGTSAAGVAGASVVAPVGNGVALDVTGPSAASTVVPLVTGGIDGSVEISSGGAHPINVDPKTIKLNANQRMLFPL
jgi:hypothetical protein